MKTRRIAGIKIAVWKGGVTVSIERTFSVPFYGASNKRYYPRQTSYIRLLRTMLATQENGEKS